MAASSVLTPSQSGIIGEGGRKVLKTRVQVLGRFLMEPGSQELGPDGAARLADRAKSGKVRVRTQITLFNTGLRLGERGLFASMPIEFVQYSRLADVVIAPGHLGVLVVSVRDYDQRCATVIQFKDDVCLRVVLDVIDRHRRAAALDDDVARISDLQSISSDLRQSGGGINSGIGGGSGNTNWRLRPASSSSINGSLGSGNLRVAEGDVQDSMLIEGDYAVTWKSRAPESPLPPRPLTFAVHTEGEAASGPPTQHQLLPTTSGGEQPQPRYQKNQQRHQSHLQQQQQQLFQRRSWNSTLSVAPIANGAIPAVADLEEFETAAVFETPDGPPTLLNELVRGNRVAGLIDTNGVHKDSATLRRRLAELPPEFVARVHVGAGDSRRSTTGKGGM